MSRFTHAHTPLLDMDTPPECVLAEVDAAWERASSALPGDLELDFDLGVFGRSLRCALRSLEGEVVDRISPSEALAIACGDAAIALTA